jgi:hypothetical protein
MITVIVPYYRQPAMLHKHLETWAQYSDAVRAALRLIVVDDCSPEPAAGVITPFRSDPKLASCVQLYRVLKDIPWNRAMARNLGAHAATTPWLLHMDIDHILPPLAACNLVFNLGLLKSNSWYRFRRFRNGRADDTRNKDYIPRSQEFGEIKPHVDSYLCTREMYWAIGGYDEDYSGCLGGGGAFLRQLGVAGVARMLPWDICLHVYTRDKVPDSSISHLDRDTSEYGRRRRIKERAGNTKAKNPLRCPWERVL